MTPTLAERLAPIITKFEGVVGEHYRRINTFIEDNGVLERRKQPGDIAPDFALPAHDGRTIKLSERLAERPAVLVFIRGMWCPYCSEQVHALADTAAEFEAAGVSVLVISPEIGGRTQALAETYQTPFPVLCDLDSGVALSYGCLFPVPLQDREFLTSIGYDLTKVYGSKAWFMPLASAFAVGQDGRVAAVFGYADARIRPEPEALIEAARSKD